MKPNEQLSWALVLVTLLAAPKWLFALGVVFQAEVLRALPVQTIPVLVTAGVCSLLLLDLSQPLSALFALIASGFAARPICLADFDCTRYEMGVFMPAIFWMIAATYPDLAGPGVRRVALVVSAFCLALFFVLIFGGNPWIWPPLLGEDFRVWEWVGVGTAVALPVIYFRSRGVRLARARSRALLWAFGPVAALLICNLLAQLAAKVWGYQPPDPTLLAIVANVALVWGLITLTRAEYARRKEVRNVRTGNQNPHVG